MHTMRRLIALWKKFSAKNMPTLLSINLTTFVDRIKAIIIQLSFLELRTIFICQIKIKYYRRVESIEIKIVITMFSNQYLNNKCV